MRYTLWNVSGAPGSAVASSQLRNRYKKQTMSNSLAPALWRRNLWIIWCAEFIAILGFSSVLPILPFYVQRLGVTSPDAVKFWSGTIFSAHAVTMAVMAPIWGSLADRYGRKPMVERAMFGGALVIGLMALARTPLQLTLLRAIQGMLTGTVAAATTLVASTAPRDQLGRSLGLLQMAVYIGSSFGPMMGGLVADTLGFQATFLTTSGLLLLGGVAVALWVREEFSPAPALRSRGLGLLNNLRIVLSSATLASVFGVRFLARMAARLMGPILPLVIQSLVPAGAAATLSGVVQGLNAAAGAGGAVLLGRLSDRLGKRRTILLSLLASAVFYIPQHFASSIVLLAVLQVASGFAMGGVITTISAALATLAPEGRQGTVYGLESTVVSLANAVGPMVGTTLAVVGGLRMPFLGAAACFSLAGLATAHLVRERALPSAGTQAREAVQTPVGR